MSWALSATQLTDIKADLGDSNGAFSDAELQRLYERAQGNYEKTVVMAIEQLIASGVTGARFIRYSQNETDEDRTKMFDQLVTLRTMWQSKVRNKAGRSQRSKVYIRREPKAKPRDA